MGKSAQNRPSTLKIGWRELRVRHSLFLSTDNQAYFWKNGLKDTTKIPVSADLLVALSFGWFWKLGITTRSLHWHSQNPETSVFAGR
jgi:hypothetical protein